MALDNRKPSLYVYGMKISCIHHAFLREKLGRDSETLELKDAATLKDAVGLLTAQYPQLAPLWPRVKYAVNDEFADLQTVLREGDRIDLLPPFGGG